ncbi:MAG: hypothetical protein A2283_08110 [Lentisphaerae bacterium RIFOXYA12_FULL_48_11]|nr:MAG: hypothetical protein A2283_08110 [Lentisphaerae bacterium RIFOXYA12_FULL_48_11]
MHKKVLVCALSIMTTLGFLILPKPIQASHAYDGPEVKLADGRNFSFSVRGSLGYLNGEARELVYDFDQGYRRKASELIWDLKGLGMIGGIASVKYSKWLNVNLGIWTTMNEGSGSMIDYDWFSDIPGAPSPNDWTDRSISDVKVVNATMFDLNASAEIFKLDQFAFHAIVGFKQDSWEWDDRANEYVYSAYSFRDTIGSFGGINVIDYEQTFSIPYLGVSANGPLGPIELSAYFLFSVTVSAEDKDYHILRDIHFKETFDGGTYIGMGLNATYRISDALFVSATLDTQTIPEIDGDMELTGPYGETLSESNTAGISHESTMLSLIVGYDF